MRFLQLLCVIFLFPCAALASQELSPPSVENCSTGEMPETVARPVDLPVLFHTIKALQDSHGQSLALSLNEKTKAKLKSLFEHTPPRTKMDQFYRMLYILAQIYPYDSKHAIKLDARSVSQILKVAGVIDNDSFLNRISKVRVTLADKNPLYEVEYTGAKVALPLNQGKGFSIYRNGFCQKTEKLLFNQKFSFQMMWLHHNQNLLVYNYSGVDLAGLFGTRGLIDLDLNYVTLESVEFINGTNMGTVKAKVSKREFQENQHSWLLKVVTHFFGDKSTQPIDW